MSAEDYVRPVTGSHEAPSERFAIWRFRIISVLLVIALGYLVYYGLFHLHIHLGSGNPQA